MISWFEFKGTNSQQFRNLIVQDLPSIVRPPMRSEFIYHDGADGATINELGYDIISKPVRIALKNTDDIDQILSWLTGSGQIIFSNEPNKYYIGKVIEQIEFQRVGRYLTAMIAFECQPYKYLHNEPAQIFTAAGTYTVYNNGTIISKPLITIYATNTVTFALNGYTYAANLNTSYPNCQIDSDIMNTYTNLYGEWQSKNVLFTEGTLSVPPYPLLNPGTNTLTISGAFTSFEILPRSRFI